jgi:hypothetical protein
VHIRLGGLNRVTLVMDGRGRTGQVVDLVHLHIKREGDVVTHQLEARIGAQMLHIVLGAAVEIVDTKHMATLIKQPLAQV